MFGNCATGIARSEMSPAIAVTSAMTTASRGRSTKIDENIALTADRLFGRHGHYGKPGPQPLQAGRSNEFAAGKAICDDDRRACCLSNFHPPDGRFSILNYEHIDALLVGDQCG